MADATRSSGGRPPGNQNTYIPTAGQFILPGSSVTQSTSAAGTVIPTTSSAHSLARCSSTGLAAAAGATGRGVPIQFLGPLTLTTAQWDAITGQHGGLSRGQAYYVGSGSGTLVQGRPPSDIGLIGVALSATTMFVRPGFAIA